MKNIKQNYADILKPTNIANLEKSATSLMETVSLGKQMIPLILKIVNMQINISFMRIATRITAGLILEIDIKIVEDIIKVDHSEENLEEEATIEEVAGITKDLVNRTRVTTIKLLNVSFTNKQVSANSEMPVPSHMETKS